MSSNIDIWVSAGEINVSPYYTFYLDSNGTTELYFRTLDISNSYTFYRLNNASSHPFYISDIDYETASSNNITLSGDGSPTSGITGTQSFTLSFNGLTTSDSLYYYCTAHNSMINIFALTNTAAQDENEDQQDNQESSYSTSTSSNWMARRPIYSNNALVFYKSGTTKGAVGSVVNSRVISRRT